MGKLNIGVWVNNTLVDPFLRAVNLNKLSGGIEDANTFYPVSGTNALTVTTPNGNYKYNANTILNLTILNENTGAMTVNVDSEGVTSLVDEEGNAFTGGEFTVGQRVTFVRNGANINFTYAPKGAVKIGDGNVVSDTFASGTDELRITITGKGVVKAINGERAWAIEVDGTRYPTTPGTFFNSLSQKGLTINVSFETSFKVYQTTGSTVAQVSIIGEYDDGQVFYGGGLLSNVSTLRLNVNGKGVFYGSPIALPVVEVDGVIVVGDLSNQLMYSNGMPMEIPFKNNLKVYLSTGGAPLSYTLK